MHILVFHDTIIFSSCHFDLIAADVLIEDVQHCVYSSNRYVSKTCLKVSVCTAVLRPNVWRNTLLSRESPVILWKRWKIKAMARTRNKMQKGKKIKSHISKFSPRYVTSYISAINWSPPPKKSVCISHYIFLA